ncbi:MAG: hypothetical protein J0H97_15380 [Alphaproteobacteria bacterium]|jgi:hypothetical protein|nr:hypothetical protein [Alphaproteobacteria bacterium]
MMPLTFTIDHDKRFVHATAAGRVVLKDVEDYFDVLMVQDAMPYPKLVDATHAQFEATDDDIMTLGARVSAYAAVDPRGPICLVAVTPDAIDILRRFSNLGGASRPSKIVATVDEGLQWLSEQAK